MQDYADYLAAEASSEIVAFHLFRLLYEDGSDGMHVFLEGEDDSLYYMPSLRRAFGDRPLHHYDCGGKWNVIDVRESIKDGGYDDRSCLFFVDRDFDDFLKTQAKEDERTYITDYYSIENHVVGPLAAAVVLEDIVHISRADPEYAKIIRDFELASEEYRRIVRPLIAWVLAAREVGCKPNLNNTKGLGDIVLIRSHGQPELAPNAFELFKRKVLGSDSGPPFRIVLKWRRRLHMRDFKLWLRGKYEYWFFQKTLLQLINETNERRRAAGGKAFRVPSAVREGRFFELLGGRIQPPRSLESFVQSRA